MTDFLHTDARWTEHFVEVSDPHKEGHHVRFYFDMAQPKQEPVICKHKQQRLNGLQCLCTTPPQRTWVGLTDEEIQGCLNGLPTQTIDVYAKRIEAKLKEKNT